MKFQRVKDIVGGAIGMAMIIGVCSSAFGKVSNMDIPVSFNNIKLIIDGKELKTDKEPFIYEGTTYLPIRAVGEAVGKTVSWDNNTQTAYLDEASVAQQDTPNIQDTISQLPYSKNELEDIIIADECLNSDLSGEFIDENGDVNLIITPKDNGYHIEIGIFRLTHMDDGVGELDGEKILFTVTDSSGDPISGEIVKTASGADVIFTNSTWEYIQNGDKYSYYH